jgi:DEAD/DEAH box helicase domain-containing protein
MKDPIGSFDIIKENFIRYVKTAFGTKFAGIEKERYDLLNFDKVLYREPWIEPLPDYLSSGNGIDDLTISDLGNALTKEEAITFKELVKTGLFPADVKLHKHQAEMLREALSGNNCIITSGTGSGKTESFLLPLFAQLAKELTNWIPPNTKSANVDNWWKELAPKQIVDAANDFKLSGNVQQRNHDTRPAGVRALILYPMNALVEDQMSRLRKALDSDDTRDWLKKVAKGNAVYFGRYNGSSPVAGELKKVKDDGTLAISTSKVNELKERLKQVEDDAKRVTQYIQTNGITGSEAKDLKSFFQRLDGSEMRCRYDMQLSPPDILITNYSMLSIMLMRDVDSGIFEETKKWLACSDLPENKRGEEKKNRVFHLIIDELHLYRGTQGTEVAYLLKLVLNRIGLHPLHPQLRILASSASLEPGKPESVKFLQDFFGVDNTVKPFKIITGENTPVIAVPENETKLPVIPFQNIAIAYDKAKGDTTQQIFIDACQQCSDSISNAFGLPKQTGNGIEQLLKTFLQPSLKLRERFYSGCELDGIHRAVCSIKAAGDSGEDKYFAESTFAKHSNKDELRKALRGVLIARALFDEPDLKKIENSLPDRKLPRFRFHYFFRNIEGIWASVKPEDGDVTFADGQRTSGKLYSATRIKSDNGNRVLELLYCDNCGTTFFGGSRLIGVNESFELLPISPNIEGIPEKTPAKLVEKRSYQEFAVFWPIGSNQEYIPHDTPQGYWRQTTINGYNQTDFSAQWVQASLNVLSGDVYMQYEKAEKEPDKWIKGYLFTVSDGNKDIANWKDVDGNVIESHKAIPCVCPACGINHQKRQNSSSKSKVSPVRGFRTGFAKTTQIFAKELMYQLPEGEKERKLVVFSDSREDAAQVSNGIERNHFTDLMREILVDELHSNLMLRFQIIEALDSGNDPKKKELRNKNQEVYDVVEDLFDKSQYKGANTTKQKEQVDASEMLNQYRSRIINARGLVDVTNSINLAPLIRHFIQLGINPGGNDNAIQSRLLSNKFVPWYNLIDFTNFQWISGVNQSFIDDIKAGAFSNLSSIFFGTLFYSFESSALGYVTINPNHARIQTDAVKLGLSEDTFLQVVNSCIRILGENYKHNHLKDDDAYPFEYPITEFKKFPSQARKYIKKIAERYAIGETNLGDAVYNILRESNLLTANTGIQIEELFVKVANQTDPVWTSLRGSRPHLHFSGGVCTYSLTNLNTQADKICIDIWEKNYLSYNAIIEKRSPIRLHCEELTGQTDNQFVRQRHFRNIILPDEGERQVKTIDLLSVTTTLEVGVDIGALQAVMLGNMPPQRFNYQQRVGRAGRRGQAYSIILTFCRGRSHDEFYFSNPHKITGDSPPTPFLTMSQPRIFRRLLGKEILRRAYLTIETNVNNDEEKSSVHGAFGKIDNWNSYKTQLISWIEKNKSEIENAVDALITPELLTDRSEFINWVCDITTQEGLIGKTQSVIDNEEISTNDISEKLAEGGILPMFGMPTTVKNLYHGISEYLEPLAINRPQAMAIYEFAPGSQKTKDKAIHTVVGFTSDLMKTRRGANKVVANANTSNNLPFSLNRWMVRCKSCGFNKTYAEAEEPQSNACPNCGNQNPTYYTKFKIKTPRAYRTNLSLGKDMKDDSELLLSRPPIFAEKSDEDPNNPDLTKTFENAELILSDKDVTWRINTNSDRFYTGKLFSTSNKFPSGHSFPFYNQWLLNDLAEPFEENGYRMYVNQTANSQDEQIALASNKKTEIFRLSPATVPLELDLNMFAKEADPMFVKAQSYGVRSGFYSAAFLLQRILADRLDVDPTEIEIADIILKKLDDATDRRTAEIILTDELPNGSGFVRYLFNHFDNLMRDAMSPAQPLSYLGKIHSHTHQQSCTDACYDCLKVYRNMNYHSLLDWRLGLSLLRSMSDANYKCGTDGNFTPYIEINNWLDFATELANNFSASFDLGTVEMIKGLAIIKWGAKNRNIIMIVHPFWNVKDMKESNWLTEIKMELDDYVTESKGKLSIIDSFNLHRRPGWCYEKLINR